MENYQIFNILELRYEYFQILIATYNHMKNIYNKNYNDNKVDVNFENKN